jgi:hypothetical protein
MDTEKSKALWAKIQKAAQALEGYKEFSWGWRIASENLQRAVEIAMLHDDKVAA